MDFATTLEKQLTLMAQQAVALLPNLAIAIVVLFLTWALARLFRRLARQASTKANLRQNLAQLAQTFTRLVVWIIGLMLAATIVIPSLTPAGLLAGLGFGAVAIGFAFKNIFENFFAGVLIMLRDKMQIGDVVEANGVLGKVERITLRETQIRQLAGELTIMPNAMIFSNAVKIITDHPIRRNELVIGVSYDTDLAAAEQVIRSAVEKIPALASGKPVEIFAQEFNSSSVDFLVRWWIDTGKDDYLGVKSAVIFAIKQALDDAGIEIPFPYVTHTFKEKVPLEECERKAA